MIVCKKCGSAEIHVGMWVNPNTNEVLTDGEPLFEYNEAPKNICTQWCSICDEGCKVKVEEVKNKIEMKGYHGGGELKGYTDKIDKDIVVIQIISCSGCHLRHGEVTTFTREDEGEAWIDVYGKPWVEVK
ncbi:hypothetical protein KAR91_54810 [Candidatus Pacearchaeota archaeon]|nr:hypothetical protein [Candidatus Pacearchaeota archaeon]